MKAFIKSANEIANELNVEISTGLSEIQAKEHEEKYGKNVLTKEKGKALFQKIIDALKDPTILILIVAALITLGVNTYTYFFAQGEPDFVESVGILLAITLAVTITIIMEGRSEKAFEALNKIRENIFVKVIRGGKLSLIPQEKIVVGDIVQFETGDKIPVDGRLIESVALQVDESPLTGESMPVKKSALDVFDNEKTPLAERSNMLYSGAYITSGQATMLVTEVGDETEFGKIAKELNETKKTLSPLQQKLEKLGKTITVIGSVAAGLVFIIQIVEIILKGTVNFDTIQEAFITSIVLIVAAVPEGLPTIVAISLALNVIKMAKQNALVKKMIACETVGCINVICSDKTGTLTENKMTVTDVFSLSGSVDLKSFNNKELINNFCINSSANIEKNTDGTYKFIGSPTECALLVAYGKSNSHPYESLRTSADVVHVFPFSSETKNMTTIIKEDGKTVAYTKGSPEKILSLVKMDESEKAKITEQITKFQNEAKRILGFAHKETCVNNCEGSRHEIEENMIFDGFAVITDPIRRDVYDAVKNCKDAGISIKMLTGDNIVTARAIASELGMVDDASQVFHAGDIENMTDKELYDNIDNIRVIARSTPLTKLRVVNMIKEKGNVVAVTGDGVNDAPAIKSADVGIAMGITGTEVSKAASDIVLLDDSFTTIVKSVQWGRGIYENFQRFIQFQLTVNMSALLTVLISIIAGFSAPFTALQLLWINIIMDGPPALTLGLEPIRKNLMKRKPTKRDANIVSKDMLWRIGLNGTIITILFLAQRFFNVLKVPQQEEETVLFAVFVMFQLFNAFNSRELDNTSVFKHIASNRAMLYVFALTFALQIFITQIGGVVFNTVALSILTWVKVFGFAFSVVVVSEIYKLFARRLQG